MSRSGALTRDFSDSVIYSADSVVVVAVPVYGGRVAGTAVERLSRLKGNGSSAVAIVLYGNRAYEDALVELQDLLEEQGFRVEAAAAFIGEHSYSRPEMPIAEGRPDGSDMDKARDFGADVAGKLLAGKFQAGKFLSGKCADERLAMRGLQYQETVRIRSRARMSRRLLCVTAVCVSDAGLVLRFVRWGPYPCRPGRLWRTVLPVRNAARV